MEQPLTFALGVAIVVYNLIPFSERNKKWIEGGWWFLPKGLTRWIMVFFGCLAIYGGINGHGAIPFLSW